MRILTLSNCPLVESQGSGYVIVNFCRRLRQRGHEVDLFGPESFELFYPFAIGRAVGYRQALGMLLFTFRQILKKRYDIIEFYGSTSWLTASILKKIPKRNFLLASHSNGIETNYSEVLKQYLNSSALDGNVRKWYQTELSFLDEQAFKQVDGIITNSDYDNQYALKHNYQQPKYILTIENSLLNSFLDLAISYDRASVIGYCGTWIVRKGIKLIQEDITNLLFEFRHISFKLIGVGNDFQKEALFPPEICNRIEVIPFVENKQDLLNLYQSIAILIMPSIYESFGLVCAEAMACGCAVVASNTGFVAGLKQREEALILEKPVSPFLYEGVKELLLNEALRLKIAQGGYQRVQNLRWELAVERLEQTYTEWLQEFKSK